MSIIDAAYFTEGELRFPIDNTDDIQFYIDEHEPNILKRLFGYALYKEFTEALAGTPAQKWIDLRDGAEYTDRSGNLQKYEGIYYIIADYVFYNIIPDFQYYTTDSGIKGGDTENAQNANPRYKQSFAWNDMVNRAYRLDEFILVSNDADSSTYENYDPNLLSKINVLNI